MRFFCLNEDVNIKAINEGPKNASDREPNILALLQSLRLQEM